MNHSLMCSSHGLSVHKSQTGNESFFIVEKPEGEAIWLYYLPLCRDYCDCHRGGGGCCRFSVVLQIWNEQVVLVGSQASEQVEWK